MNQSSGIIRLASTTASPATLHSNPVLPRVVSGRAVT